MRWGKWLGIATCGRHPTSTILVIVILFLNIVIVIAIIITIIVITIIIIIIAIYHRTAAILVSAIIFFLTLLIICNYPHHHDHHHSPYGPPPHPKTNNKQTKQLAYFSVGGLGLVTCFFFPGLFFFNWIIFCWKNTKKSFQKDKTHSDCLDGWESDRDRDPGSFPPQLNSSTLLSLRFCFFFWFNQRSIPQFCFCLVSAFFSLLPFSSFGLSSDTILLSTSQLWFWFNFIHTNEMKKSHFGV